MKHKIRCSIISRIYGFSLFIGLILFWATFLSAMEGDGAGHGALMKISKAPAQEKGLKEGDVTEKDRLNEQEGKYLLSVARKTIESKLFKAGNNEQVNSDFSDKFSDKRGTFVTLTKNNNLRGCIGHIIPQETLLEGVQVNAINAAFRDPRFPPLSKEEWDSIKIEVSILTEPKPLEYKDAGDLLDKLRPDIDGVIIKKDFRQATFLPQVWEQLPDKKEFLMHLCMKAGLDANEWKSGELEVSTYQAQAFEEH
jgi:AmmeMemoRadiSam system protein A